MVPHPLNNLTWHSEPCHGPPLPHFLLTFLCVPRSLPVPVFLNDFHPIVYCLCAFTGTVLSLWHAFPHTCLANSYLFFKAQRKSLPQEALWEPCCLCATRALSNTQPTEQSRLKNRQENIRACHMWKVKLCFALLQLHMRCALGYNVKKVFTMHLSIKKKRFGKQCFKERMKFCTPCHSILHWSESAEVVRCPALDTKQPGVWARFVP